MEVLATTKEKVRSNLSQNLKRYRKLRGWDQHGLAVAANLSQPGVAGYEQKKRFPKPRELELLASACGTTPDKLLEDPVAEYTKKVSVSSPTSRTQLLGSLVEESLKLDYDDLVVVLGFLRVQVRSATKRKPVRDLEDKG